MNSRPFFHGRSVRAISQESSTPITSAIDWRTTRERHRVPQGLENRRIAEGAAPAGKAVDRSFAGSGELKAAHQQQQKRRQDQKRDHGEKHRDTNRRRAQSRAIWAEKLRRRLKLWP